MEIEELKQLRKNLDKLKDEINKLGKIGKFGTIWKEEVNAVIDTITSIIKTKNIK